MPNRFILLALAFAAVLVLMSATSRTASAAIDNLKSTEGKCLGDAFLYSDNPNWNSGALGYYEIGPRYATDNTNGSWGLLKWDISSIPTGMSIDNAQLYVYCCDPDADFYIAAYTSSNISWNENTVTWNTKPTWENLMDNVRVPNAVGWYHWNVTKAVQSAVNAGWDNVTIYLIWSGPYNPKLDELFCSQTSDAEYAPHLEVTYYNWLAIESWSGDVSTAANSWSEIESWTGTGVAPDFTINVSPSSGSVQQGSSTTVTVDILAINGYNNTVTLSASGVPSVGFDPVSGTPSFSSTMTIFVGSGVSPSSYTIVITGTGSDGPARTASYSLTVTQSQQQQQNPSPSPSSSPSSAPPSDTVPPIIDILEPTSKDVSENVTVRFKVADSSGVNSGFISVALDNMPVQYTLDGDIARITFTGLGAGEHVVKITAKDASSNHNEASAAVSFTVTRRATPVTSALAVGVGENVIATFNNENIPLREVKISPEENLGENRALEGFVVSVRVVENSSAASLGNVRIYACLEISISSHENILTSTILNFVIPKTWLLSNNLDPMAVALYHMEDGTWVELQTARVGEDNVCVYYSALTHSFSPFVIGAKTLSPTFSLALPSTPFKVEGGYVQVSVWVCNPTSSQITKQLELRFGGQVQMFEVVASPGDNVPFSVNVSADGISDGDYDMGLYDAVTGEMIDSGRVTLSSAAGQTKTAVPIVLPPIPAYLIVFGGASGVIAALGALMFVGKLPVPRMPGRGLRGRSAGGRRPKVLVKERPTALQRYEESLAPAASDFSEEAPIVQDYFNLLLPAAIEASAKENVEHIGRAVKPHRRASRGQRIGA